MALEPVALFESLVELGLLLAGLPVSPGAPPELLDDVIMHALDEFKGPIATGLRSGHVSRQNVTLTFGAEAELILAAEPQLKLKGLR